MTKTRKNGKNRVKNSLIWSKFLVSAVVVLLLGTGIVVTGSEFSEKGDRGVKVAAQTVYTYFTDNATLAARSDYNNSTGQGWMVFWTDWNKGTGTGIGNDDGIITGCEKSALDWVYKPADTDTRYANDHDVLYQDTYSEVGPDGEKNGWDIYSQATIIAINASAGTIGWTYTKNTSNEGVWGLDEYEMVVIPVPEASLAGSDIELTWTSIAAQWLRYTLDDGNTTSDTEVHAQYIGCRVYRSTTNATWNDNPAMGPVSGNISDWQLVSGPGVILNTTWTDTAVEVGKTYYYSLKPVFNASCPVETMWGGLGSNPVTVTDIIPPIIEHIPPFTSVLVDTPIQINATITDVSGLKSATLYYKGVGATQYTQVIMTNTTAPHIYSAKIPAQASKGKVYYYITASDKYGNLARAPPTRDYEIEIVEKLGGVIGRVINSTNEKEGIAGANVTVFNEALNLYFYNDSTSATGYFKITDIPPGNYTIRASKQFYWRDERPVKVMAGETTENVTLALYYDAEAPTIDLSKATPPDGAIVTNRTPTISIGYTDNYYGKDGTTLPSVRLKINDKTVTPTITKTSVIYTPPLTEALDDGKYTVYVCFEDMAGNHCEKEWSFTIITKGSLQGYINDYYGNAIQNALVELRNESEVVKENLTDQNGCYRFENITEGSYTISVRKEDYTFKTTTVKIIPNQVIYKNFIAEALRNYTYGYVLEYKTNKPIVGAKVTISSQFYIACAYTNLSGYYKISGVPQGTYNLTAEKDGYLIDTTINCKFTAKESKKQDFWLEAKVVQPTEPKKPPFIPNVSFVVALGALLAVVGLKAIRRKRKKTNS